MENCKQGTVQCHSVGSEQEHEVFSGNGTLVYIEKATKRVGMVLKLNEVSLVCGDFPVKLKGSIVIPITPINTKTSTLDLKMHGEKGRADFRYYENEKSEKVKAILESEFAGTKIFRESDLVVNEGKELGLPTSKPVTIKA
jgi:hypothetical protein